MLLSAADSLAANLATRGPMPLNVLQLVPHICDLREFADVMSSKIRACDSLLPPGWEGTLREALIGNLLYRSFVVMFFECIAYRSVIVIYVSTIFPLIHFLVIRVIQELLHV